mgnify:CR=1 FL=1
MNRLAIIVGASLIFAFACEADPPSGPPSSARLREEAPPPMLVSEKTALLDFVTAIREIEMEIKRVELEWNPEARASVVERHREALEAVRHRIRSIRDDIEERRPQASYDFRSKAERVEQKLADFEARVEVLEAAIAHFAEQDQAARAELP